VRGLSMVLNLHIPGHRKGASNENNGASSAIGFIRFFMLHRWSRIWCERSLHALPQVRKAMPVGLCRKGFLLARPGTIGWVGTTGSV